MNVRACFICLCALIAVPSAAHGAAPPADGLKPPPDHTHELSFGFLSHKTGLSLLSYAHTLWSTQHQEVYVGGGTLIAVNTAAFGWKGVLQAPFVDVYAVGAMLVMVGMSEHIIPAPMVSAGLELGLCGNLSLNAGVNTLARVYLDGDGFHRRPDLLALPQASLALRW